jgi:anion-transporting  ArsA/GET3 family ATPase
VRIPIPDHIRSAVISSWMSGKSRDKIASEVNISTGSVSNIIEQWQNSIGVFDANNLRELGLALKNAGISPIQCANGLRINNILNQLGIDEDHLFDFLNKLYNESKEQKLSPADLPRLVKVINDFPEINSLNELPKTIKKRQQEKIKLDADIYYKKLEIQKLDNEKENKRKEIQDLQEDLESFRNERREEKKDFMLFKDAKAELKKHGIFIHI